MTVEELLRKFEDSDKFKLMNYDSVDSFLEGGDYLIIRPDKIDDFQFVVIKQKDNYNFQVVINDRNGTEINFNVSNEHQLETLLNITIQSLKNNDYKKYAKCLEKMM